MKTHAYFLLSLFLSTINSFFAQNISTGLNASYVSLPTGGTDAHWTITAGPTGPQSAFCEPSFTGYWEPTPVSGTGASYIDPVGAWGQATPGYYTFETPFTVNPGEASFLADFGIGCDDALISAELVPPSGPTIPLIVPPGTPNTYWVGPSVNYTVPSPVAGTWKIRIVVWYVDALGGLLVSGRIVHDPLCDILTLTVTPGPCDANNNYTLTGTLSYVNNPGTGPLNISLNNGTSLIVQPLSPPFTDNQVYSFSFPGLPGDGAPVTVEASFSDDPSCIETVIYTAPFCVTPPCNIATLTVAPGACDATHNYTLNGTLSYINNPGTGTLVVTVNNGSNLYTQTFNPPFTDNQVYNFSISNIPGDAAVTSVTAVFTSSTSCNKTTTYTAPFCPPCNILTLTATPSACDASYNYSVDGTISYVNNPGTGTLTVTADNGSGTYVQTFNPPFTDNQVFNYSIPNVPGDGANTAVTAVFSDDASCTQTALLTAPICRCTILEGNYSMSGCDIDSNFVFSGHVTFVASPPTGTLTITVTAASGVYSQVFNAPFSNNVPLSFSIPGILSDNSPASATAIFSDDTHCFYDFGNFTTPGCPCGINADFRLSPAVVTLPSTTTQMVNLTGNGLGYYWTFGDGTSSTVENPHHTYPADSVYDYLVTLVAIGPGGCKDSMSHYVTIQDQVIFYVPNAFTPDGNEFNQLFAPVFVSDYDPYSFSMYIFDRWGEVIFESHNASVGWDGTYNGSLVQDGTYSWKIEYKVLENDSHHEALGHVSLLH